MRLPLTLCWICLIICCAVSPCQDAGAQDESTANAEPLKTLRDHFPFDVPDTLEQWKIRRNHLRQRVLVATGLWPMPTKTDLQPMVYGKTKREGFTVEKIVFQSLPGHYVTGLLFRPAPDNQYGVIDGKRPAVLSPHGHGGRNQMLSDKDLERQIESGGEIYRESGRSPKLARCAHLARMGCVTLIFDMLGYADSQQIAYEVAHRHADPRPEESESAEPCFFSIDADLNLQSIMGLQTWNAIRALDFLAQLPDVDPDRLGVTGGSGGGTQTILLDAIDDRIKVSFPNGMVSTSMQGGCYCENCNYLRIGTGNVELAAIFAPKPQGMTAANDWTKDMMNDGFPQLQELYQMYGAEANVMCRPLLHFPHNYNYVTRATMYPWMARYFHLPDDAPRQETDYTALSDDEMTVWDETHPAPIESGIEHERKVLKWWKSESDRAVAASTENHDEYRNLVGAAWKIIFDRTVPKLADLQITEPSTKPQQTSPEFSIVHPAWQTSTHVVDASPQPSKATGVTLIVGPQDYQEATQLANRFSSTNNEPHRLLFLKPSLFQDIATGQQRLIDDKRTYSAFTFGYNRPRAVKRYQQILCAIAAFSRPGQPLRLIASSNDAFPAAAAASLHPNQIKHLFVESKDNDTPLHYSDANFIPGSKKYLGLAGLLALRAPEPLTIVANEQQDFSVTQKIYRSSSDLSIKID